MKKIKLLLLSVMFLFCIMSGCGTQTEANTSVNEDTDNSLSVNDVKIHIPEDYVQVHMLSECREILDEMLTDLDLRHEKIDIASYEIIHCQSVEGTGFYVKEIVSSEKVGEEVRNCTHGGVGVVV